MKSGIASDTTKSARTLAQQIAKQIAQEPLEVLKTAKEQTVGTEAPRQPENQPQQAPEGESKELTEQKKIQDNLKGQRRLEALNRELEDIRKGDVFKDLQERISAGEKVMLEEYPELTDPQKEMLETQMQNVQNQIAQQQAQGGAVLEIPVSKKGRKMGGQKQEAEKQQTRVEKPVPPSG